MKCKVLFAMFFVFLLVSYAGATVPNFGNDGLQGLTDAQIKEISSGKIIVTTSEPTEDEVTKARSSLITAVMIFEKSPEQVFDLLYRSEDQIKFLPEIKDVKVISKTDKDNNIEFKTRAAVFTFVYRVIHKFDKNNLYMDWAIDKNFKNDLQDLRGFWKFYPYPGGKTLARYGSNVSIKGVPEWVENIFKATGVKNALKNVKKYIDTGWTYR
jgi:ribosome-associated toxin RatA of RatAB toxin-antitoxin module